MTFGVVEKEEPLLGQLIALAFRALGHDCLVFRDTVHATHVLHSKRVDSIIVGIQMPGVIGLAWLEAVAATWPDLPSRTLLLTHVVLTNEDAVRVRRLGAEILFRPMSIVGVKLLVLGRLQKARSERARGRRRGREQSTPAALLN